MPRPNSVTDEMIKQWGEDSRPVFDAFEDGISAADERGQPFMTESVYAACWLSDLLDGASAPFELRTRAVDLFAKMNASMYRMWQQREKTREPDPWWNAEIIFNAARLNSLSGGDEG